MVDAAVYRLDLTAPESGFYWYRMSKLEHHLVNLRHIQHHTGQLATASGRKPIEAWSGLAGCPNQRAPDFGHLYQYLAALKPAR